MEPKPARPPRSPSRALTAALLALAAMSCGDGDRPIAGLEPFRPGAVRQLFNYAHFEEGYDQARSGPCLWPKGVAAEGWPASYCRPAPADAAAEPEIRAALATLGVRSERWPAGCRTAAAAECGELRAALRCFGTSALTAADRDACHGVRIERARGEAAMAVVRLSGGRCSPTGEGCSNRWAMLDLTAAPRVAFTGVGGLVFAEHGPAKRYVAIGETRGGDTRDSPREVRRWRRTASGDYVLECRRAIPGAAAWPQERQAAIAALDAC